MINHILWNLGITAKKKEYLIQYRLKNRTLLRVKRSEYYERVQRGVLNTMKLQLMNILGSTTCVLCGYADIRCLQFDHIHGGGSTDYKTKGIGIPFYKYYLEHRVEAKEKLQVLCANCNWKKRYDYEENRLRVGKKITQRLWNKKRRKELLELLGFQCVICRCIDVGCLHIDHKNGGGRKDTRRFGGTHKQISYYLLNPQEAADKLQILCANHNLLKKIEMREGFKHRKAPI